MTFTTFREAVMHALRVWQAMAIIASRNGLMLVGVTGHTGHLAMLGLAG